MKKFKYKDYEQEIEFDFTDNQINQSVGNAATQPQSLDSQPSTTQQRNKDQMKALTM